MVTLAAAIFKIRKDLASVPRLSAATLSNRVVTRTPTLSGSLQASWTPSIGSPRVNNVTIGGPNPSGTRSEISTVINRLMAGDDFYFVNGKAYAPRIEYEAWSAKRPEGMLRVSVAQWQAINDSEVRKRG